MIRLLLIIPTKQSLTNMRRRFINKVQNATFNDYMFIEALYDNTHIQIYGCSPTLMYKVGSDNWQTVGNDYLNYTLQYTGQKIFFKDVKAVTPFGVGNFNANVGFKVGGDFRSLFLGDKVKENSPLIPSCFDSMFYNSNLTDFYENILYYPKLAEGCYSYMFQGCSKLTTAPELPATTLADLCYAGMFQNCSNLTSAPQLPATALADGCYCYMFQDCTSLTTVPELLPATTLVEYCYSYMFNNCSSLTTAPELPATTLIDGCYSHMFNNCAKLTTAPELPATTLAEWCYVGMFSYCNKLNYIKMLATDISARDCLYDWVENVSPTGTFVKNPNLTSLPTGTDGIPEGWTVISNV